MPGERRMLVLMVGEQGPILALMGEKREEGPVWVGYCLAPPDFSQALLEECGCTHGSRGLPVNRP